MLSCSMFRTNKIITCMFINQLKLIYISGTGFIRSAAVFIKLVAVFINLQLVIKYCDFD